MCYDIVECLSLYIDRMDVILSILDRHKQTLKYSDGKERKTAVDNVFYKFALSRRIL